MFELNF